MVIVAPLCKVIGKLQSGHIGIGIFKVNNDKLFVLISWVQERRFARRFET